MSEPSDLANFDPAYPGTNEQIAGLLFALVLVDPNLQIAQVNQAAETMLGKSAKRLISKDLIDVIGPLDPRVEYRLGTNDAALVAREITILTGEVEKRVNMTVSPLVSHPGPGAGSFG